MKLSDIWFGTIVSAVTNISDPVRVAVRSTIVELNKKAQMTSNPWDNIFVEFLAGLLGVDLEEKKDV